MLHSGGPERRGSRLRGRPLHLTIIGLSAIAVLAAACSATPDGSAAPPVSGEASGTPPALGGGSTTTTVAPGGTGGTGGTATTFRQATAPQSIGGCTLHPSDHFLNATNVDTLPVHRDSAKWIAGLGGASSVLKFPSAKVWDSARAGMPINVVDSRVTGFTNVVLNPWGSPRSYRGPYPIPDNPKVQGYPSAQWDKHLLIVDVADCTAYELIQYDPVVATLTGVHSALSGARYRLDSTEFPTITTNAPQTPMLGQYVMRSEVVAGEVAHPVGFCSNRISTTYQWPARRSDGVVSTPDAMPMGTWIRLRSDADLRGFGPDARTVARALREHGAILTDTCSHPFFLMAENSAAWNDDDLAAIRSLTADDFEVVDTTPMQSDPGSFRIR